MEKKNSNKKFKNVRSYQSFLNLDISKMAKEEKNYNLDDKLYINIDPKNSLIPTTDKDLLLANLRIENFKEKKINKNNEEEIKKENLTKSIMKQFLNKLYPKCEVSARFISNTISWEIRNKKKLNRYKIEEYINYFFTKRFDLKYSTSLKFTKDFFTNCGNILCYVFSKFNNNNIKQIGGIKKYINRIIKENINVIIDFYDYCTEKGEDPSEMKKVVAWREIKKKYEIPPEMIFLVNVLQGIDTLEFDIEFYGEILNEEDLKLFTITILNISYILPKLEHVKINFINNNLQYSLYEKYYTKIFNILIIREEYIKKNKIKNIYSIYNQKWDFEHDFNLEEYRQDQIENDKKMNKIYNLKFDKYSIIYMIDNNNIIINEKRNSICNSAIFKISKTIKTTTCGDYEIISEDEEEDEDYLRKMKHTKTTLNEQEIKNTQHDNRNSSDTSQQKSLIYNIILMTICGVTRIDSIKRLNLLSNDFYNRDLIIYLKKNFGIDVISIDKEFHTLDLLYNKTKNLDLLNIEINSLEILSFDKILGVIYKNQSLNSLNLSLFSSDVSYLIIALFKAYEEIKSKDEIVNYILNEEKNLTAENFENKIINDISIYFIENINLLFEIIKTKDNLEVLGLNFDLPNILINNINYNVPIIKFILNIILLIDNNESKNKNKIKKLTLLSPNTELDNKISTHINNIFKDIRIYKKNNTNLQELSIQIKLYNIIYIKNIISTNLIKLSIGDLDIITFEELINYLTSFEFSRKSLLSSLTIKILKNITYFNTKLKLLLRKLFDIKIKSLLELKFFSNIIISNKMNYIYLLNIMKNNWIPSYVITLNEKSKDIQTKFNNIKNEIKFLVSNCIRDIIFKDVPQDSINKNRNSQNNDINDEVLWMLKYIFYCRYSNWGLNFLEIKNINFSIFKYLYFTSSIKLRHKLEESPKYS